VSIQHVNIPDGERHEPKGVSLATTGQVYVADGAASGAWRKVKENDLDFTDASANKFGWNYRRDDTYTSGSPLTISSGVKTLFTNDGDGALTDVTRPLGISYSTNSFTPSTLNSSYVIRIAFKVTAAATAGTPYTIKVAMEGGATPLQFAAQDVAIKGGGYVNDVALTFLFFTGALNTNEPISIYLTPDTNVNVYNLDYLIQRTYVES
jgi:hypothetical protein